MTPERFLARVRNRLKWPEDTSTVRALRLAKISLMLTSEAGEFANEVERTWGRGKPIDDETRRKLGLELGDIFFGCFAALDALNLKFEDVLAANDEKLSARLLARPATILDDFRCASHACAKPPAYAFTKANGRQIGLVCYDHGYVDGKQPNALFAYAMGLPIVHLPDGRFGADGAGVYPPPGPEPQMPHAVAALCPVCDLRVEGIRGVDGKVQIVRSCIHLKGWGDAEHVSGMFIDGNGIGATVRFERVK